MNEAKFLSDAARKGATLGDCGRMCSDCAFRVGSDANNDAAAVTAAMYCLQGAATFNCHSDSFSDAGVPCAGYKYAMQYFDSLDRLAANPSLSHVAPNTD